MSGRRFPLRAAALVVAAILGGCSAGTPSPDPSTVPAATASPPPTVAPATPSPAPASATVPAATTDAPAVGPPAARLAAEGGDPVEGQLGTYVWADGGSDSPWLPGTPITVGAGEPLAVTLDPATAIEQWRARIVPAGATEPAGATALAEGAGSPRFAAPDGGAWTLEVQVTFADGLGTAHYAWALTVT